MSLCGAASAGEKSVPPAAATYPKGGKDKPDSFKYYGPNGLWSKWNDSQRIGRDTWIFWTWGNQKFLRKVAVLAGNLAVPVSLDFFRALDSRNRGTCAAGENVRGPVRERFSADDPFGQAPENRQPRCVFCRVCRSRR